MARVYSFRLPRWFWVFLLVAVSVSGCTGAGQITLAVTNNSGQPIQAVVARFTGGAAQFGALKVGERQETTIKPAGESHIELDIYPAGGKVELRQVDTYFEEGYRGKIEIILNEGFVVHTSGQLSVR